MRKDMNKIGILGYGEIGRSIEQLYVKSPNPGYSILIKDVDRNDGLEGIEVLNICIPYQNEEQFVSSVAKEISTYNPLLTINHSTVKPGTTNIISDLTESLIVHSPVRGIHPNLYEGLKTFVKFIGSDVSDASLLAEKHYKDLEIETRLCSSTRTTELGKLFSTTYYGLAIAWHGEMKNICDQVGVSYDEAVTHFNETYNTGYTKLGKTNVVRPVLYPPDPNIGGHCIVPNTKILKQFSKSLAYDLIEKYEKDE